MTESDGGAEHHADHGSQNAPQHCLAGAERIRAKHRERAEDDPERVLDSGELREEDGQAESDGAADAVAQPHRVPSDVPARAFGRRREGTAHAFGLAAEHPLPPRPALRAGGQRDVRADRRDRVGELLRPEAGVQDRDHRVRRSTRTAVGHRLREHGGLHVGASLCEPSESRLEGGGVRAVLGEHQRSLVERVGGGALDRPGGRVRRFRHRGRTPRVPLELGHHRVEPGELVDQPDDGPRGRAQAGRPVRRSEERLVQGRDFGVCLRAGPVAVGDQRRVTVTQQEGGFCAQPAGERPDRLDRRTAQRLARGRRPQHGHRDDADDRSDPPPEQPRSEGCDGPRERDRKDESQ